MNKITDKTPVIRELLDSWGREKVIKRSHFFTKVTSCKWEQRGVRRGSWGNKSLSSWDLV